ncbi:hypothetical protein KFE25_009934 [Diacronema lutheri]|uniref:Uncharacterized protein n=1 Tax=Diacronema lutheri TaxID=2081491 RepID=A0A8J5XG70_DIALT|nr:hypothetical protein KFE25_009934 [Diacronema lutheri]
MDEEGEHDASLKSAQDAFSRTGQEEHKLLKADGYDTRAASVSLIERLLTTDPKRAELAKDAERLGGVMECTGFSVDEATRTLLLWQEISGLREQGLSTVDIVHHFTKRLKCAHVARGRLADAASAENLGACSRKQKFSGWADVDGPQPLAPPATAKRGRLQYK